MSDATHASDDAALLAASRAGDTAAFALLWDRHRLAGITAARSIAPSLDAEDLVSDAYLKILELLADGRGPTGAFRPYLYQVIRSRVADAYRSPEVSDDGLEDIAASSAGSPWHDRTFDQQAAAEAFATLGERWQAVLWYMEVEGLPPREVAKYLGMSANSVSALHRRARNALQSAWVEAHVNRSASDAACRSTLEHLQRYQRGKLTAALSRTVETHLSGCERCEKAAKEYSHLNAKLALVLATIFVGGGAAQELLTGFGTATAAASSGGSASHGGSSTGASVGASSASIVPGVLVGVGVAAALAVGGLAFAIPLLSEQDAALGSADAPTVSSPDAHTGGGTPAAPIPSPSVELPENDKAAPVSPEVDDGDLLEEAPDERDPIEVPPAGSEGGGDDGDPADGGGDEDGGDLPSDPDDGSDPALSVFDLCYLEQDGPGSYNLTGYAPEYGVIRAQITQDADIGPIPIVPPGFESVDDAYGNTFTDIFSGTDPAQGNWWWSDSLAPLSQWSGLDDAAIDTVTVELRFFTPDGRFSPWVEVGSLSLCV